MILLAATTGCAVFTEGQATMSKLQLVEAIRHINRSATEEFLLTFDEAALTQYLDHLQYRLSPRRSRAAWIRPGDTAAVVCRRTRAAA